MKRILIAAIVGGIIVFIWSAVAHMITPLGMAGFSVLGDREESFIEALRANVPKSGMYMIPGEEDAQDLTPEQEKAWMDKIRRGPYALVVYTAGGSEPFDPMQLIRELVSTIIAAFIVAWILSLTGGPYFTRVIIVTLFAVFAWFSLTQSYWTWYKFPTAFVLAEAATEILGWFLAGLAMAKIVRPRVAVAL